MKTIKYIMFIAAILVFSAVPLSTKGAEITIRDDLTLLKDGEPWFPILHHYNLIEGDWFQPAVQHYDSAEAAGFNGVILGGSGQGRTCGGWYGVLCPWGNFRVNNSASFNTGTENLCEGLYGNDEMRFTCNYAADNTASLISFLEPRDWVFFDEGFSFQPYGFLYEEGEPCGPFRCSAADPVGKRHAATDGVFQYCGGSAPFAGFYVADELNNVPRDWGNNLWGEEDFIALRDMALEQRDYILQQDPNAKIFMSFSPSTAARVNQDAPTEEGIWIPLTGPLARQHWVTECSLLSEAADIVGVDWSWCHFTRYSNYIGKHDVMDNPGGVIDTSVRTQGMYAHYLVDLVAQPQNKPAILTLNWPYLGSLPEPSVEELKSAWVQCYVAGIKGFVLYSWGAYREDFNPPYNEWDLRHQLLRHVMGRVFKPLNERGVLAAYDATTQPTVSAGEADLEHLTKQDDPDVWTFAVDRSPEGWSWPYNATFSGYGEISGPIEVFKDGQDYGQRWLWPENGSFEDTFIRLQSHIYHVYTGGFHDVVDVTSHLVVPAGQNLIITPGTVIRFAEGIYLDVYGTLTAVGTAEDPIVFEGFDETRWGGIGVFSTGQVTMHHCEISSAIDGIYFHNCLQPQEVDKCTISDVTYSGIYADHVNQGNLTVKYCTIEDCMYGIEGNFSAGFFDRNTIQNCQRAGIYWWGDHPLDPEQPVFFGNSIQNCGTNAPIAGGYFGNTESMLVCNTFSNNHVNQLLCQSNGDVILNGTLILGGVTNKGTNTFEADETGVLCYGDYITCIQAKPLPGWEPLMTIMFSQPQLAEGKNNFIWAVDGIYIETKLSGYPFCHTQPIHEIGQNYFSPSDELPGPGNNRFCPHQLYSVRHDFLLFTHHCAFPIEGGGFDREGAEEDYFLAVEAEDAGDATLAETRYLGVIENYPTTIYAVWSTAGYLRTVKQQNGDPLEAYQVLSSIHSDADYPDYLQMKAGMNAIRSLLTAQQFDWAEQDLGEFLANAVSFEDSTWAILMIEAIPLLEGGGGPSTQSVGGTPQSHRAAARAYHNRVLEILGHQVESEESETTIASMPTSYALHQNYPNPFNASTRITFDLPEAGLVTLKVYDVLGRKVATLIEGVREAGYHSSQFDGLNLPSGIYFCRLETGGIVKAKKMVMLK